MRGRSLSRRSGARYSPVRPSRTWPANWPACGCVRRTGCGASSSGWTTISRTTNASWRSVPGVAVGAQRSNWRDRLAVAKAEHARHRADQVARHEIAIVPYVDGLLLVAEPAWRMAFRWTARTSRRRASRRASCRVRDGGKSGLSTTRRCDRLCLAKSFRFVRERQRVQTFGECTRIHSMPLTLCFENGLDFRLSVPDRKR